MTEETIVAVYDSAEHAALAVCDLEAAGVPSAAITQHAKGGLATGSSMTTTAPARGLHLVRVNYAKLPEMITERLE